MQEGGAERAGDVELGAARQIAQIIRADAARLALDRQRQIVGVRLLAVAGAGDGIEPHQMRLAVGRGARRDDADALAFQHRKRLVAEIQDDVAHVGIGVGMGEAEIAGHRRLRGLAAVVEIDRRLAGGMRRHRLAAEPLARFLKQRADFIFQRLDRFAGLAAVDFLLRRQVAPGKLLLQRIGLCDNAPVVDRAGRARRDAVHAVIADFGVDHVVVVVMRHRVDRAGLLAGVAPDADFGIDQMLFFERCVHGSVTSPGRGSGIRQPLR